MARPAYTRLDIDLTVARNFQEVLGIGNAYDGVIINTLPVGATVSIAFGPNSPLIPLLQQGQDLHFLDMCANPFFANEGLFISNPAGIGTLVLIVSVGTVQA